MSLLSYIIPQTIFRTQSKFNGEIKVITSFGKNYIEAGGLMQSGTFLEQIWDSGIKKLRFDSINPQKILILGLCGGSLARVINRRFPEAKIIGVDIDATIIHVAKTFLNLDTVKNLEIYIRDAQKYIQAAVSKEEKFDLIFVDLYTGYEIPDFVEKEKFLKILKKTLTTRGHIVFNRLYIRNTQNETDVFLDKLHGLFHSVESKRIYGNLIIKI